MKKGFGVLLIILGIAVFFVFILSFLWMPPKDYTHTGKELFTQEQYVEFKEVMASRNTEIRSINILDDVYPILIDYTFVSLEEAVIFNEDVTENVDYKFIYVSPACLVFFVPAVCLLEERKEVIKKCA